jgi:NAD(P)-dependent dehydrogenase (short-subunit alcohol dehydrogenase family)
MNIENNLITGANRGIGRALAEEAPRRGAQRVYTGAHGPLQHSDNRGTPLILEVTSCADPVGCRKRGSLIEPCMKSDRGRNVRPEFHEERKDDDHANDTKSRNEGREDIRI